jgi:hypothetical protein
MIEATLASRSAKLSTQHVISNPLQLLYYHHTSTDDSADDEYHNLGKLDYISTSYTGMYTRQIHLLKTTVNKRPMLSSTRAEMLVGSQISSSKETLVSRQSSAFWYSFALTYNSSRSQLYHSDDVHTYDTCITNWLIVRRIYEAAL